MWHVTQMRTHTHTHTHTEYALYTHMLHANMREHRLTEAIGLGLKYHRDNMCTQCSKAHRIDLNLINNQAG